MNYEPKTRDQAYLILLRFGLIWVRDLAWSGRIDLCEIEADHLHNIPSLIGETSEDRHTYYLDVERGLYLERLHALEVTEFMAEYLERVDILYSGPWRVLADIAGVGLI
jgi:hypothetical protein